MRDRSRGAPAALVVAFVLVLAACSSAAPVSPAATLASPGATATPSAAPTPMPTPGSTPAATASPTPAATAPPAPTPSPTPTAAPTVSPTLVAQPSLGVTPSPLASLPADSAFTFAGITSQFEENAPSDPSTFATVFPAGAQVYVEYALRPGLTGSVSGTLVKTNGTPLDSREFTYPEGAPWAWFGLPVYPQGQYEYVLRFGPSGDEVRLPLWLVAPTGSPAAFTLLTMATAADPSRSTPDPATYTGSFPASVETIYVVFALRDGLSGAVTCDLMRDARSILQSPLQLSYGTNNSWGDFEINIGGNQPPGVYVAVVRFEPTRESQAIEFTLDASPSP